MHSNCGVIEDCSGCHGWRGERIKLILEKIGFVFDVEEKHGGEEEEVI